MFPERVLPALFERNSFKTVSDTSRMLSKARRSRFSKLSRQKSKCAGARILLLLIPFAMRPTPSERLSETATKQPVAAGAWLPMVLVDLPPSAARPSASQNL